MSTLTVFPSDLLPRKQKQNKGRLILAGLSFSLLLTYAFFLLAMVGSPGSHLCTFAAVAVHYSLLSAFCWMVVEAIVLYLGIHKNLFQVSTDVKILPAVVFSYGTFGIIFVNIIT